MTISSTLNITLTLTCDALGGPNNTFSIRYFGTEVTNDSVFVVDPSQGEVGGVYLCMVMNTAGSGSATYSVNSKSQSDP